MRILHGLIALALNVIFRVTRYGHRLFFRFSSPSSYWSTSKAFFSLEARTEKLNTMTWTPIAKSLMLCCLVTTFSITEIDMDDNDNQQRSLFELFRKANGGEEFYSSNQGWQPTLTKRVLLLRPQSSPSLTKTPHLDTDLVNPSSNISEIYVSGLRKERFITKRDCIKPSWFNELHQTTGSSTISIEGGDANGIC